MFKLLWLMCRHHSFERHVFYAFKEITGKKQKLSKTIFLNLKMPSFLKTLLVKIMFFRTGNKGTTKAALNQAKK